MRRLIHVAGAMAIVFAVPFTAFADDHLEVETAPGAEAEKRTFMVEGGGGLPIAVTVAGNPEGPAIVFMHSLMGSTMNWEKQYESDLGKTHRLVSLDMRGHGASAKPVFAGSYTDPRLHAEDIAAAIKASGVEKPTLVAWAYGGLNVMDYVRHYGTDGVSGIVLVEANGGLEPTPEPIKDAAYRARIARSQSADLATLRQWTWEFGDYLMRAGPLPQEEAEIIRTSSMLVPHWVRAAMRDRPTDNSDLVETLEVPVLFVVTVEEGIGREMIERIAGKLPDAEIATIPNGGSLSFWYETERFNEIVADFIAGK
ncbi:alpha/beta fold hydrolase [Altererythrobacter sp. GH1-8]|uniref:alpha/beta fold hydrolase n=1 Tax=Altererythrobacter sp. GH1-8 TaxID=3349333 RepID=UPI00374D2A83